MLADKAQDRLRRNRALLAELEEERLIGAIDAANPEFFGAQLYQPVLQQVVHRVRHRAETVAHLIHNQLQVFFALDRCDALV